MLARARRANGSLHSDVAKYLEPFFSRDCPSFVAVPSAGSEHESAYYANFATCINEYGLTDAYIAHSQLSTRGRIGHEKKAADEYLQKRHVDFELQHVVSNLPTELDGNIIAFQIPDIGFWQLARLITYDSSIMNES